MVISSCNLYEITESKKSSTYDNGMTKAINISVSKKSKKFEMHDYYQRWDMEYKEYYKNGNKSSESLQSYKRGTYGRPCTEIISYYKEYYNNGKLKTERIDKCDCRSSVYKEYDKNGTLILKKKRLSKI